MNHIPDFEYPESYYEFIEETMGADAARWARLPREERMKEIAWFHAHFNTPDDLSFWPPELGGDENARLSE